MILSDKTIVKLNNDGLLVEQKLKPKQIQPNSIDLSLANSYKKLLPNVVIDMKEVYAKATNIGGTGKNLTFETERKKRLSIYPCQ